MDPLFRWMLWWEELWLEQLLLFGLETGLTLLPPLVSSLFSVFWLIPPELMIYSNNNNTKVLIFRIQLFLTLNASTFLIHRSTLGNNRLISLCSQHCWFCWLQWFHMSPFINALVSWNWDVPYHTKTLCFTDIFSCLNQLDCRSLVDHNFFGSTSLSVIIFAKEKKVKLKETVLVRTKKKKHYLNQWVIYLWENVLMFLQSLTIQTNYQNWY